LASLPSRIIFIQRATGTRAFGILIDNGERRGQRPAQTQCQPRPPEPGSSNHRLSAGSLSMRAIKMGRLLRGRLLCVDPRPAGVDRETGGRPGECRVNLPPKKLPAQARDVRAPC